ncbi:hypothetical protein LCGC14_1670020 [marine sediment metagenome]|uniref:Uncharacterized protein n=1 Tax=marine sediment metagenome TaxID=412755 RepID=A0A0F9KRM0_9ZZZZ
MVDTNIYGWTYAEFNIAFGWDMDGQLKYEAWENFWSRKVDTYIFNDSGTTPRLTDANEVIDAGDIVNKMMAMMNIYLKGESVENPLGMGILEPSRFPRFEGQPKGNGGLGTGDYVVLNRLKRKYGEIRVASFRIGIIPNDNPFYQDRL